MATQVFTTLVQWVSQWLNAARQVHTQQAKGCGKKLAVTSRPIQGSVSSKEGNIVITAVYELIWIKAPEFYRDGGIQCEIYQHSIDREGGSTRTINKIAGKEFSYTLNLFHTTSNVLINGKNPDKGHFDLSQFALWFRGKVSLSKLYSSLKGGPSQLFFS